MTGYRTQPNPDQPDRCPSIDPDDTLQCGRRIHNDDQCQFGGIAWKKGTPRHVSDRERADAAEAKLANVRTALMQGGQNDRARWRDAVVALDLEPTCDPWSLPCPEHGDKHWRDALDLAHRAIDRMLKGDAEVARLLDLPLPDDESLWPDYLADGLPETATARMKALADERAKAARVEALVDTFHEKELDTGAASYDLAQAETRVESDELARESEIWREARAMLRAALAAPQSEPTDRDVVGDYLARLRSMDPSVSLAKHIDEVEAERTVCPECVQGKHGNCDGTAWDDTADAPTACTCPVSDHQGGA